MVALSLLGASVADVRCQWAGCCTSGCLPVVPLLLLCWSVAWVGVVVVPGEFLLELFVGVGLGRGFLMVVPALLSMVCSLLVVMLLVVLPVSVM